MHYGWDMGHLSVQELSLKRRVQLFTDCFYNRKENCSCVCRCMYMCVCYAQYPPCLVVHTPLIPVLGRQRQADLCEFKASLVYRASSRIVRDATQRNPVLKTKKGKIGSLIETWGLPISLILLAKELYLLLWHEFYTMNMHYSPWVLKCLLGRKLGRKAKLRMIRRK